jgi:hypothetical protein
MKLLLTALLLVGTVAFAQTPAKDPKKPAPKAAPAAKPAPAPAMGGFLGNKESKTFHKAECKLAAKMKAENKMSFATKAEAEKAGFKGCKVCKP